MNTRKDWIRIKTRMKAAVDAMGVGSGAKKNAVWRHVLHGNGLLVLSDLVLFT